MKKIAALTLALMLLAGCSAETVKTGLGVVTEREGTSATAEKAGKGKATVTAAALTVDSKGKIVSISIDAVQPYFEYDATGVLTTDVNAEVRTKKELKEEYGMLPASPIKKEWYQQTEDFEKWATGKALADVVGMKTKVLNDAHPSVPDVADLATTVSMDVGAFIKAIQKASDSAK